MRNQLLFYESTSCSLCKSITLDFLGGASPLMEGKRMLPKSCEAAGVRGACRGRSELEEDTSSPPTHTDGCASHRKLVKWPNSSAHKEKELWSSGVAGSRPGSRVFTSLVIRAETPGVGGGSSSGGFIFLVFIMQLHLWRDSNP